MKIENDEVDGYNVYLDGQLFSTDKRIVLSADTKTGNITYIFKKDHFPFWPSLENGEVRLEKINNG